MTDQGLTFIYIVQISSFTWGLEWKGNSHSSDWPGPDCYLYYSNI